MSARPVCPECGAPVEPDGPGRRARCPDCLALVELPYLPRAAPGRRRPRRRSSSAGWAWVVIAVAAGVIGVLLTYQLVRNRVRDGQRRTFETLLAESQADDHAGDLGRALDRLTTALTLARDQRLADAARLDALEATRADLEARRDERRRREAEAKAASELDAARAAFQSTRPEIARAVDHCETAYAVTREIPTPRARELSESARSLAASLVRDRGVDLPEPAGTFLDPSRGPATYVARVRPILVQHLEGRGYLPARPGSPLADLWPAQAPLRLVARVDEAAEGEYMESVLKTSRLDLRLDLEQSGRPIWTTRVTGRTREPAPRIPASASAVFAVARKRDPDAERRLYDDAMDHLTGLLPTRLANLPPYVAASPGG
jgi:hypothetical protein